MKPKQYVAIVGALDCDDNYSHLTTALGPFTDYDKAVSAGITEVDRKNNEPGPEYAYSILPLTTNEP